MMSFNLSESFATTHNVAVSNFQFTPTNLNVAVGDTIKWNWVSGGHTTTCDGIQMAVPDLQEQHRGTLL